MPRWFEVTEKKNCVIRTSSCSQNFEFSPELALGSDAHKHDSINLSLLAMSLIRIFNQICSQPEDVRAEWHRRCFRPGCNESYALQAYL